ncbi:DUF5057 domain-containing protein [Paenibacillus wynnii]|uniref:DUF5057 domain-containing protein n=1 Tax=Paenibacillus wynnii TaxID=268407 RepID=UPI000691FC7D|nr:DUF5057 domain-containing protein [Paenibacillus wynnii]
MKIARNKVLYLFSGMILLILLLVFPIRYLIMNVNATGDIYQIRMLEITDSGVTELSKLKSGMSNITIDTMSMKRFVALRDDWDGKYDAVYIGKGAYNKSGVTSKSTDTASVRATAHDTKTVMNDITALKAKEITDNFINKGLYVIFNKAPFDNQKAAEQGILYNTFNKYRVKATSKPNVLFKDDKEMDTMITSLINNANSTYLPGLKQRPRLHLTNKSTITDYSTDQNYMYTPGNTLTFNFNVANVSDFQTHPILAKLYVSVDKSIPMTETQVVAVSTLNRANGTITYRLPNTYSGLLYWKLEISDYLNSNKLKDFDTGTIRFHGKKPIVNILQILPNTGDGSSLRIQSNMKQEYLNTTDYQLNITPISMTNFNNYVETKYAADGSYGLNGVYDMLIFGFRDEYNAKATIKPLTSEAVFNFANVTKQSVMFTHDTVYNKDSDWVKYFKDTTGQIEPLTNLGLNAPNTSKSVKPVNDGLLTQYPFYLSALNTNNEQYSLLTPQVATTHNQYYTLNLEDPTIIPWYNIEGSKRDINDSWNHYYTYSKGNVTYSGTGHIFGISTETFPDWEQKLFVNTMYRAFTGANHLPEITVNAPIDNSVIPSYMNELLVDYNVQDWDLNDRNLKTSIRFKSLGKDLSSMDIGETAVQSGNNIHKYFTNPLPQGGKLEIEIKAWDTHGAMATKTITLSIIKATANLEATRSLPSDILNGVVERDKPITITYSVVPKPIAFTDAKSIIDISGKQAISNIVFTEQLPPNLEVDETSSDVTKSGTLQSGYSLTKTLSDITYTLQSDNGVKTFVPEPGQAATFRVSVIPKVTGSYNLGTSTLNYNDIHALPGALLQDAADYNLFLTDGDLSIGNLQVEGRIAASGNVDLRYGGASINPLGNGVTPIKDAVVAGRDLYYNQNTTIYGNAVYGGNFNLDAGSNKNSIKGTVGKGTPINFAVVKENLITLSTTLGTLNQNRTVAEPYYGKTTLSANDGEGTQLYVFNVSGSNISTSSSIDINVPSGSTVLVNIDGDSDQMHLDTNLTGVDASHVIYNFTQATHLTLRNTIKGTILAPKAQITFDNAQITGQIIGRSITHSSTINFLPFKGSITLPAPPLLSGSVQFSPTPLTFHAVVKITNISLEPTTILLNDIIPTKLIAEITPVDATDPLLYWTSSKPDFVSVNPSTGEVTGLKLGSSDITATATDGSKKFGVAKVTVVGRSLRIEGSGTSKPSTTVPLRAIYDTTNETGITYTWEVQDDKGNLFPELITSNQGEAVFNSPDSGTYTVTVKVTSNKVKDLPASKEIIVSNPLQSLTIIGDHSVIVGGELNLNVLISPTDADTTELVWSLVGNTNNQYATLTPVTGGTGYTLRANQLPTSGLKVRVTAPSLEISSNYHDVEITGLTGLEFSIERLDIHVGQSYSLITLLWPNPRAVSLEQIRNELLWSATNSTIASFTSPVTILNRGVIVGNKPGTTTVTVSYSPPGQSTAITAQIDVRVLPPTTSNGDRY